MKRIASDFDRFKRDGVAFVKECNRKIERKRQSMLTACSAKVVLPAGVEPTTAP